MQNTPKNFFLQFGIIVTLYASVVSFLAFFFELIDTLLPRANTAYFDYSNDAIRYSISVLIVMFPLFIWLSRMHRKSVKETPKLADSKLRKWLLYFTLFLAGLAIAIDVIVLINTFLRGDNFALPFLLKVLSVLVVAGSISSFYLKDIKGYWESNQKRAKSIATLTSAIVLVSVVGGVILIGSPSHQRDLRNDMTRINDLASIQMQVVDYYQAKGKLPESTNGVVDAIVGNTVPKDPETSAHYKYEVTGPLEFKLCASFKTDSKETNRDGFHSVSMVPVDMTMVDENHWDHGVGEKCYDRKIDKDRFPIQTLKK